MQMNFRTCRCDWRSVNDEKESFMLQRRSFHKRADFICLLLDGALWAYIEISLCLIWAAVLVTIRVHSPFRCETTQYPLVITNPGLSINISLSLKKQRRKPVHKPASFRCKLTDAHEVTVTSTTRKIVATLARPLHNNGARPRLNRSGPVINSMVDFITLLRNRSQTLES